MDTLPAECDDVPSWLLKSGAARGGLEASFQLQSLADLIQHYEEEGFDENGHLSFDTKKARARLWTLWESFCESHKICSSQTWLDLHVGKKNVQKYFQAFLENYVQQSVVLRPCLGPEEWKSVRTINRATTVEALWATLVSVADQKVMDVKRQENPEHAHYWILDINSQHKGSRNKHACDIAKWIGKLAVKIGLSLGQLFTKQEMTTTDVLRLLDTLWIRAADIPCNPQSRSAFHSVVVLSGIGGWRQGGLLGLPYRCVELAFVRDPLHPEKFRLAARITINQIKQKTDGIKRDQSDIMSFTIGFIPYGALCLLSFFVRQAIKDNAFKAGYISPEQLINPSLPTVPKDVNWVNLAWKKEWLDKPIIPISYDTFLKIWKRALFVAGFRVIPRPYSMRYGASGRLDGSLTPAVRNYILSQSTAIHEKFYNPVQVRANLMKIAYGAGAAENDKIVEMYRNASLTHDPYAPIYLTVGELESFDSRRDLALLKAVQRVETRAGNKKRVNQISARIHHIVDALETLVLEGKRVRYFAEADKLRSLGHSAEHLYNQAAVNPRRKYHTRFHELAMQIGYCLRRDKEDERLGHYMMCYLRQQDLKVKDEVKDDRAKAERQPRCLRCCKSFANKAGLNKHVWISHSFDDAFHCPECHALGRPSALVQPGKHSWSYHVSEAHEHPDVPEPRSIRAFCCLLCDEKFTQKGIQEHFKRKHIKTNRFNTPLECPACRKQGRKAIIEGLGPWVEHAKAVHQGDENFFGAVQDRATCLNDKVPSPQLKRGAEAEHVDDYITSRWKRMPAQNNAGPKPLLKRKANDDVDDVPSKSSKIGG